MNDYGNNIILASQAGCELVLITEEGGDFPVGSKVFYYDDNGVRKSFDTTTVKNIISKFSDNQNINIDWAVGLPLSESYTNSFKNSAIKSFNDNNARKSIVYDAKQCFKDCKNLKRIDNFEMFNPKPAGPVPMPSIAGSELCSGCTSLEYINMKGTAAMANYSNAFNGCTSLADLDFEFVGSYGQSKAFQTFIATNMFSGCKLNSHILQKILSSSPKITSAPITIGYDPSSLDPNVDKPEGSELTWAEAFAEKKWTVTWEAYVEPVENAPKLLKAAKQKLYKLDEVAEEMLDMLGDSAVYVKGGKHYLMTSGDSVTAPGTDGALLRDTEVENVVRAGSLQEAIDLLGAALAEK